MDKIAKIEKLSFEELISTVENLINRLEYRDIQNNNGIIIASEESPLSTTKHLFIFFEEKLSGISDVEPYAERILHYQKQNLANSIYVVSNQNISSGFQRTLAEFLSNIKIDFIDRDRLISLINLSYQEFWRHDDLMLIEYEKQFCEGYVKEQI